ncbi:MAG: hypothetical protein ACKVP0_22610 [Pirellulaceae bacterium]
MLLALAEHFIFIRGQTAAVTAEFLTRWALNPRHVSKDIHNDLVRGTDVVAKEIHRMCAWFAAKRDPQKRPRTAEDSSCRLFAADEITCLQEKLRSVPQTERVSLADFLLSFLIFAKRHGQPTKDGTARHAAPAVNAVIRKWPGCHHMHYKERIQLATELGIIRLQREKWQNPSGPGRARTYELLVKVSCQAETLDFDEARRQLIDPSIDPAGEQANEKANISTGSDSQKEPNHEHHQRIDPTSATIKPRTYASAVHQGRTRGRLAPRPRQRPPQPYAPKGLRRRCTPVMRAVSSCIGIFNSSFFHIHLNRVRQGAHSQLKRGPPVASSLNPAGSN